MRSSVSSLVKCLTLAAQLMTVPAEQLFQVLAEIVHQEQDEAALGRFIAAPADEAGDGPVAFFQEATQDMDAEKARRAGENDVTEGLGGELVQVVHGVDGDQLVDGGIVEIRRRIGLAGFAHAADGAGKLAGGGIGKDILVYDVVALVHGIGDDLCRTDGAAADVKEAVRGADPVEAENLGVFRADFAFQRRRRFHKLFFLRAALGLGKGAAVHLLILVQGNAVQLHEGRRHHVGGFPAADEIRELSEIKLCVRNDIGRDVFAAEGLVLKGLDGDVADAVVFADDALDLGELDTEAADLDLTVVAADEVDPAVIETPHNIARAEDPVKARLGAEGIRRKDLRCFFGLVQVAAADAVSRDPQFAQGADGKQAAAGIGDI